MNQQQQKQPAFQFYPGDWRKDPELRSVSLKARGLWIELLCLMHESSRRGYLQTRDGKAFDEARLAWMVGTDQESLSECLNELIEYGVCSIEEGSGVLYSRKMASTAHISQMRSEAGILGGNPNLLKQKSKQTPKQTVNQKPTPSASASAASSASISSEASLPEPETDQAGKFEECIEFIHQRFPGTSNEKAWEVVRACRALGSGVTPEEALAILLKTDKRDKQDKAGLWCLTIPELGPKILRRLRKHGRFDHGPDASSCDICYGNGEVLKAEYAQREGESSHDFTDRLSRHWGSTEIYEPCSNCATPKYEVGSADTPRKGPQLVAREVA